MFKKIIDERHGEINYEVNEKGIVRNINTKKVISQQEHNGYKVVSLRKGKTKFKRRVNRLVAIAFLNKKEFKSMPNEKIEGIDLNSLEVNHIDLNRSNNDISNLEWCTRAYNRLHGYENNQNYCRKKAVVGINKETKEEIEFDSLYMAGKYFCEDGCKEKIISQHSTAIVTSIKKGWSAYGYCWKYKKN